ncbi:MAG: IS110 family transposase [Hyphomicrobiales bacterium]|nr:IS110 family transposase [Hyphomicrobiales bacterium]
MKFVGVDLHKKTISVCVMVTAEGKRKVACRKRFYCVDVDAIGEFFTQLGDFQVAVEATSSYEWFLLLVERLADRCVLVHPKKLRVIAESKNKSDKVDAQVLAEFLLLDMLPEAWRPTPRVREHRVLVRHRRWIDRRITGVKCKLRHKVANYNADIEGLFTEKGEAHLKQVQVSGADRFEIGHLQGELQLYQTQLQAADKQLRQFAKTAPVAEREARAVLKTFPFVGPVTIDAVLSELGDWRRFRSIKRVVSYAGLNPGFRESAGKAKQLSISKEGSRILRWALIQTAWRLVNNLAKWKHMFETLQRNTGSKKKAIVGVARRVLCAMFAMLRDGKSYEYAIV